MRKTSLNIVHDLAREDKRVVFIGSDLGVGTLDEMKEELPGQFFMEGVSEQHLVSMCAGLALEGKIPYFNTIGTFITRRCFEQIALDLCLHNTKVRLIGNGGGFVYAPLGPTHQIIEDFAILRALPNMTIIAPADAEEMKRLMPQTKDLPGPVYIRLGKGYDPVVTPDKDLKIGEGIKVREGSDAALITTGIMLKYGLAAAELLKAEGIELKVLHIPTVKPLDHSFILENLKDLKAAVTLEEHSKIGGLGSAVCELIAESGSGLDLKFKRMGIPDCFAEEYGSQASIIKSFGLDEHGCVKVIKELLG